MWLGAGAAAITTVLGGLGLFPLLRSAVFAQLSRPDVAAAFAPRCSVESFAVKI